MEEKILITGAFGQIGSELVPELQKRHGKENVIVLGHKNIPTGFEGILEKGDVRSKEDINMLMKKYQITTIYHLASLLSANGEKNPMLAWDINMTGLKNVLDVAVEFKARVFWPSSIAVFGPTTPRNNTPQHTVIEPTTMYGVTKLAGEMLCQYYHLKLGLDVRSLRYPGLLSFKAEPGGGTTDYAVAIFYEALKAKKYTCFVRADTVLPMMYMDDAIKATLMIMDAKPEKIKVRTSYNLAAISFSAEELANEIKTYIPEFTVDYVPDERQKIADSWPQVIDDSDARKDWGWKHQVDLKKMTKIMLDNLRKKLGVKK
ncbi:MAG: NAD-dependent epimerase/dehydratase family protein [Candidatus Woesearchaeota archaeon]|jgi:nucleoside-diphosphate-sugar epimerase